jgi:transmembrane sensor
MSQDEQIRDAIAQRAVDWFLAHRSGSMTQGEREAFFAWLKASPVHVEEYLGIAAAERGIAEAARIPEMTIEDLKRLALEEEPDRVIKLSAATPALDRPRTGPTAEVDSAAATRAPEVNAPITPGGQIAPTHLQTGAVEIPARRRWFPMAAAASAAAVALGVVWLLQAPSPAVAQTFRTAHGAQQEYRLADGSALRLDSDSEVSVLLSSSERVATLVRGQVLFQVAHDAHRSFRVRSGDVDALAVGTEFDVYRRPDATLITVIEGQIAVSDTRPDGSGAPREIKVGAGQQVRITGTAFPGAPTPADLRAATSWLSHKIAFEQLPLEEVAAEFNRYNAAQIAIEDPALKRLPVSGVFDASDIDSFTAFLASLDGADVTRTATSIVVVRRGHTSRARPDR